MPTRPSAHTAATVCVVAVVIGAPLLAAMPASALSNDTPPSSYAVAQGTTCTVVTPVTDQSQNVSAFYDYRNPYPNVTDHPRSESYSSFGTAAYQERLRSTLFFYAGSSGTSVVFVHDQHDPRPANTSVSELEGGSTVTFRFSGLPAGSWAVQDDLYPYMDDVWKVHDGAWQAAFAPATWYSFEPRPGAAGTAVVDWKWGPYRTDGGAYRGLDGLDGTLTIDPGFNEDATYWGDWGFSDAPSHRMRGWRLVGADGTTRALDMDRRAFVHRGSCLETPPSANVTANATGSTVTFDASASRDDGELRRARLHGDGDARHRPGVRARRDTREHPDGPLRVHRGGRVGRHLPRVAGGVVRDG